MDFAPGYQRDENNWILFPTQDRKDRKPLFPDEVMKHPAKMNLYLLQAIMDYVSAEGDTLLDPMAGTGTIMIAAIFGRKVVCIELEDGYYNLEVIARDTLEESIPNLAPILLLHGDVRDFLPITCDHIIFSPPYAGAMDIRRVRKKREDAPDDWLVEQDKRMLEYSKHPRNLSKLNTFMYNQQMEKVYKLCYASLPDGGTLSIVIKDRIEGGKRTYLSKWINKVCLTAGFQMDIWEKWKAPGHGFTNIARSQGRLTVQDEDILIFRRV